MFILNYLSTYYIMLFEMIGLIILLHASVHVSRRAVRLTAISVFLLFVNSLLYSAEQWTQTFETLSVWRPILTYTIYSLQPIILIVVTMITMRPNKKQLWFLIPEAIAIPMYFSSPATNLVCSFSDDNHYVGGTFSYLPYVIFCFYLALYLVQLAWQYIKNKKREGMGTVVIIFFALAGALIYWLFDLSNDYSVIFTTAILLHYLYHYIQMSKIDPLTGLKFRQCYYRDLEASRREITAVVSIDMNDLKRLNDSKGHGEGDRALKTVAQCLDVNDKKKSVYRIGGDEFFILYCGKCGYDVENDIDSMRKRLAKTPYVCAFGYAFVYDGDIDTALREADLKMYENKSALKREVLEQGGQLCRRHDDIVIQ